MSQAVPAVDSDGLADASVSLILAHQTDGGAFPASPDFGQYRYCWLRDASFTAYALDLAGEHSAALKYHEWVNRTIGMQGIGAVMEAAIEARLDDAPVDKAGLPPARFSLAGGVVSDDWPNFQIDGYGTWLWTLSQHLRLSGADSLPAGFGPTVDRTGRYLSAFALEPCFDVWEEHGDEVHGSTLGSVYAGLNAAGSMLADGALSDRAAEIRDHIASQARQAGYYAKSNLRREVDASVLWLAAPFGAADAGDPLFRATVAAIEGRLMLDGGLRRYAGDTYFGGGAWPVLTCSLGWYYCTQGRLDDARRCLSWTAAHFDSEGRLGEQFGGESRDPGHYRDWVREWGTPAQTLLWSHAMYVILFTATEAAQSAVNLNQAMR